MRGICKDGFIYHVALEIFNESGSVSGYFGGKEKKVKESDMQKYGAVKKLSMEEIFGY